MALAGIPGIVFPPHHLDHPVNEDDHRGGNQQLDNRINNLRVDFGEYRNILCGVSNTG